MVFHRSAGGFEVKSSMVLWLQDKRVRRTSRRSIGRSTISAVPRWCMITARSMHDHNVVNEFAQFLMKGLGERLLSVLCHRGALRRV